MLSCCNFLVIEQLKGGSGSRQLCLCNKTDSMFLPIACNSIDRNNTYVPLASHVKQKLTVSGFAIGVENLTNDRPRFQTSDTHQIDRCLGMPAPLQRASWACTQWEDMSRIR